MVSFLIVKINISFNNCKFERITTSITGAIGSHTKNKDYMPVNVTIYNCIFNDVDICIYAPDYKNLICDKNKADNVATFLALEPSDNSGRCTCNVTNNHYDGKGRNKTIGHMNNIPEGRFIFQLNHQYRDDSIQIFSQYGLLILNYVQLAYFVRLYLHFSFVEYISLLL